MNKPTVVIVDSHLLFRAGVTQAIADHYEVIGGAGGGKNGIKIVRKAKPKLCVVNAALPGMSGIALVKKLSTQGPTIFMMLFDSADVDNMFRSIEAGALGYVIKGSNAGYAHNPTHFSHDNMPPSV